jgi:VWFA-related protein
MEADGIIGYSPELVLGRFLLVMHRPIRVVASILVAGLYLAVTPAAQQQPTAPAPSGSAPPQGPTPVFRSGIDSISVDVSVTDRQGRPVTDLTAADFEIREEGKPQTVEAFRLIRIDADRERPMPTRDILSTTEHAVEVAREDNRLLVIFLDDYHTRLQNGWVIREKLAQFVLGLQPYDLVALTMPLRPASALTFSRNHEVTASQIMAFKGRKFNYLPEHPIEAQYQNEHPAVQERMRNRWTIASLRALCEYMGSLRNGRKTILYVSEGMTNTFPQGVQTVGAPRIDPYAPLGTFGAPQAGTAQNSAQLLESMEIVMDLSSRVFNVAARTNTAIYTIDPRGLANFEYSVADSVGLDMDKRMLTQTTDVLRTIADETNGRAIVNRNDPLPALDQMMRDGSAYYLLGYTSSAGFRDGKFHKIDVRVRRKDVDVRHRKGYWAISPEEMERAMAAVKPPIPEDVNSALNVLATSASSARRQPVSLWLGAMKGPAEKALVTFVWEAGDASAAPSERVDYLTITAESRGETVYTGRVDRDASVLTPSGKVSFETPAGTVRVRADLTHASGRRLESADVTLEVPDFSSAQPQITTPFVFRGRTARDLQQLRASPSPMPTTARTFSRQERILLRFAAYGPGGTTPALTMKVLNNQGTSMASMPPPTLTKDQTFETEFSLGGFPPGEYVIEIIADVNGTTSRKLLAIRISG